ncbi:SIS domain-containing protein [Lacticaseibacillus saniviri]|uniref:Tagatose-6-phosphate ketose aldose isomerase n=1 Tax=Lacticaseibacillus saniviri JCM 17471 = DSM 24301 TaxID=1293598 RepID=A0A0R2MS17_9LACO|nr:SIS domain-containing protein [Lacticaseibacillus saniviri]KRO16376.1 tagatose-6-phosphate ketose aldose isomerase [Lacticaseibacillus saniviri JCM 17471 = DSM 24301]MCG4282220.1 SIS domain-containing protein [Lacticaseibacillus saniviri]
MFEKSIEDLIKMGANITTSEIKQQPALWLEAHDLYEAHKADIAAFLEKVQNETTGIVRVIFTGAGTSAYVGDTIKPYLSMHGDRSKYRFESIPTTDIVSSPYDNLEADTPTILVSFARSGNSPESVKTVELAEQVVKHLYQITITCAPDGELAKRAEGEASNLVLLQPAGSNDKGFAMTGSFSCMTLTALLVFDTASDSDKAAWVKEISDMGHEVVMREEEIQDIVNEDFARITYLGSGSLGGLTREAQLKVLELTAGQYATVFDTSMGFRHGPKSFVNDKTLVFDFLNNNDYTRQYDVDVMEEINGDHIAKRVVAVGISAANNFSGENFFFANGDVNLPEAYLALPDIMFAQTVALLSSVKVGNLPDTPSPTGTVNRVVKGVILHDYKG